MALLIRKSGLLTTVQDLGRTGFRRFGINPNGVTDTFAARAINVLLNNPEDAAVVEMHFPAGEFEFEKTCCFALGGAEFGAELDGAKIANWAVHKVTKGCILRFTERVLGNRAYLGVAGGFNVHEWLESASTNLVAGCGGLEGRPVDKGDHVAFADSAFGAVGRKLSRSIIPIYNRFPTVRIVAGPEYEWLTADSQKY